MRITDDLYVGTTRQKLQNSLTNVAGAMGKFQMIKLIKKSEMELLEIIYTVSEVKNSSPCSSVDRTQLMKQSTYLKVIIAVGNKQKQTERG